MSALTVTSAGTWTLDPVHSTIAFELPYLAGTFRGQFTDVAFDHLPGSRVHAPGARPVLQADEDDVDAVDGALPVEMRTVGEAGIAGERYDVPFLDHLPYGSYQPGIVGE